MDEKTSNAIDENLETHERGRMKHRLGDQKSPGERSRKEKEVRVGVRG